MYVLPQSFLVDKISRFSVTQRILHECSCIIEFIKRVGEKDKMRGFSCSSATETS